MSPLSVVFFGSHEFAVTILDALISAPDISVVAVVTQPDKPVGRKKLLSPTPVALAAQDRGIIVYKYASLREVSLPICDVAIVAQYGNLIPSTLLEQPAHGTLNVHTSLLPKYRGASPIQSALLAGEKTTGVTIMKMDAGLDTGPILSQKEIRIEPHETYLDLDRRLAVVGSLLLLETLPAYIAGTRVPIPQDDTAATTCKQLSRDDGRIDWTATTAHIYNQFRALTPWPGIWTTWQGKRLKLLSVAPTQAPVSAGTVTTEKGRLIIGTGDGAIEVHTLQLEGKPAVSASSFISGHAAIDTAPLV